MASRGRAKWKPQSGFGSDFGAEAQSATIPYALIKNARHSGQLNLSNRNLTEVPTQVRILCNKHGKVKVKVKL